MARISKAPAERRVELIEAAERLFSARGYDKTAVSDIVHELSIAQGTFYYYFKSKEDVLRAVIEHDLQTMRDEVGSVRQADRDARGKLEGIINVILSFNEKRESLFRYIHLEKNALLHEMFMRRLMDLFTPITREVLLEGIFQGCFRIRHASETAEILLLVVAHLNDSVHFVQETADHAHRQEAAEYFLCKLLGMEEGAFALHF
jgi:AcrR family transcriptional regulator